MSPKPSGETNSEIDFLRKRAKANSPTNRSVDSNEDRAFTRWRDERKNEAIALVADGISRCKFGSGARAAAIVEHTIVEQHIRQAWEAQKLDGIEVLRTALVEANEQIVLARRRSGRTADCRPDGHRRGRLLGLAGKNAHCGVRRHPHLSLARRRESSVAIV